MGMRYTYVGSATYPRFNSELKGIVELFGGKMITNRKPQNECTMVEYFMEEPLAYEVPESAPKAFAYWVNHPYEILKQEQVKEIYEYMKPKWRQVKHISNQIARELEYCIEYNSRWSIS